MDKALVEAAIAEQLGLLEDLKGLVSNYGWNINYLKEDLALRVEMSPAAHPDTRFCLRLICDDYPEHAPSLQFVDKKTGKTGAEYWPSAGPAFQAAVNRDRNLPQLCIPGIREFHEGCHRGDGNKPWNPKRYTFARILEDVQILLDEAFP